MWWFVVKAVCADMKGTTSWKTYAMETFLNSYIEIKEKIVFEFCSICSMCTYIRSYRWRRRHTRRSNQWPENSILRSCQSSLDSSVRRAGKLLVCVRVCVYVCVCVRVCMRLYMRVYVWVHMISDVFGCNYECVETHFTTLSLCSPCTHPYPTPTWSLTPSVFVSSFLPTFFHSFFFSLTPAGQDDQGRITTMGRGGSDLTATVIGSAAGVDEIQVKGGIWCLT